LIDDHSWLVYTELHCDERAATVAGFVVRALTFYATHGISARTCRPTITSLCQEPQPA
jgi:hypothetical protein